MKPIAIINNNYKNFLSAEYLVGTVCNYDCHYCAQINRDGKIKFTNDLETVKKNLGHMLSIYRTTLNKTNIRLNITGGEPTLWPKLGEFAEYCSNVLGCSVSLVTNGSRKLNWWKEYAQFFDDICISIHNEYTQSDHIIEVMDWIYNNTDCLINANVMMDPANWDKSVAITKTLAEHPTPWLLKVRPVLINGDMGKFTSEQTAYIKDKIKKLPPSEWLQKMKDLGRLYDPDNGMQLILNNNETIKADTFTIMENDWYRFYNWKCNIGLDRFMIGFNGEIHGACGARNLFNLDTPLSIYDVDFTEKFTASTLVETTCKQMWCECPTEIKLPKRKQL